MVKKITRILWDNEAKKSLHTIYQYIKHRESIGQAKRVRKKIIEEVRKISLFPQKSSREPNLKSEKGDFRFKVIWSYKIIYEVTENSILILDIFHTSRDPEDISTMQVE